MHMKNKNKLSKEVGGRLRDWRENYPTRDNKKLTQKELAVMLGTVKQTVGMWERGEALPPTEYLPKLASVFNVTCDEILTGTPANYVKVTNEMGLNRKAIHAFIRWRKGVSSSIYGGTEVERQSLIDERVEELSNALASPKLLNYLADFLHTKPVEKGYYFGLNGNAAHDAFVNLECSPDAYASMLLAQIALMLENERRGGSGLRPYSPYKQRIEEAAAKVLESGI